MKRYSPHPINTPALTVRPAIATQVNRPTVATSSVGGNTHTQIVNRNLHGSQRLPSTILPRSTVHPVDVIHRQSHIVQPSVHVNRLHTVPVHRPQVYTTPKLSVLSDK